MGTPDRPHILILMPDQQRADCLSCAGHPVVRTPNMDRIAAEGVRFSGAYTNCPVSMPARSTFLSGLFCHNHGQWDNYGHLPPDADTYPRRLQAVGYHTCHIGKSHLYAHAAGDHLEKHKPFMHALGWDDVQETTGPHATKTCESILSDHWRRVGCLDLFRDDYRRRGQVGVTAAWPSPLPPGEHMDDFVGRLAVEYVRNYARPQPLLLFVGFGGPHEPWDPPPDWAGRYDPADVDSPLPPAHPPAWLPPEAAEHQRRLEGDKGTVAPEVVAKIRSLYYAKISHIDSWFGMILDALQERGFLDETAVIHWSDHGEMLFDHGRVYKSVFHESSARVPLVVRPPRCTSAGKVCAGLVSLVDAFPTILELAGCPPKKSCFGTSLMPLVRDPAGRLHDAVFSEIDARTMVRDERFKMVVDNRGIVLKLYDLAADPTEAVNLVGRPDMADTVCRLRDRLLTWHLATPSRQKE